MHKAGMTSNQPSNIQAQATDTTSKRCTHAISNSESVTQGQTLVASLSSASSCLAAKWAGISLWLGPYLWGVPSRQVLQLPQMWTRPNLQVTQALSSDGLPLPGSSRTDSRGHGKGCNCERSCVVRSMSSLPTGAPDLHVAITQHTVFALLRSS